MFLQSELVKKFHLFILWKFKNLSSSLKIAYHCLQIIIMECATTTRSINDGGLQSSEIVPTGVLWILNTVKAREHVAIYQSSSG